MITKTFDNKWYPRDILQIFLNEPYCFLLESSMVNAMRGRYSILGFLPFAVHRQKNEGNLDRLKREFNQFTAGTERIDLPFLSGIVGFIGYDYGLHQEKIKQRSIDDLNLPDCHFGFYDAVIVIDHLKKKLTITSSGLPEKNKLMKEKRARERLEGIVRKLSALESTQRGQGFWGHGNSLEGRLESNFTKESYLQAVRRSLDYIRRGDIYQVNLSQRFTFKAEEKLSPHSLYQALSRISPSPFGAFLDAGEFQIVSSSPEQFLRLTEKTVQTRPMKGTRPRGINREEDEIFRKEILESPKERAELLMVTDLERNDLGRVCEYGSIAVKQMRTIEAYKTVYQATATIEGKLRKDKDCFDLLQATFPGGSVTGCPKIRSMEIIESLEPTRRGIYTGSLGYIDFNGNMNFNILIRTLLSRGREVFFQAGGGIVADSTPISEYEETLIKAKAMNQALSAAQSESQENYLPLAASLTNATS